MVNRHRGETALMVAGETLPMRLTLGALAELEHAFAVDNLPALGERFIARGQVIRAGRQIVVTQGECVAVSDGREAVVAIMTATMAQVAPR